MSKLAKYKQYGSVWVVLTFLLTTTVMTMAQGQIAPNRIDRRLPANWAVLTANGVYGGYVLYGNGSMQGLDGECMTRLSASKQRVSWVAPGRFDTVAKLPGMADCDLVDAALARDPIVGEWWVAAINATNEGSLVYRDDNYRKLDSTCITHLVQDGVPIKQVDRGRIDWMIRYADLAVADCNTVRAQFGEPVRDKMGNRDIVSVSGASDGFVLNQDGSAQHIDPKCMKVLRDDGAVIWQIASQRIASYRHLVAGNCESLLRAQKVLTLPPNLQFFNSEHWSLAQTVQSQRKRQLIAEIKPSVRAQLGSALAAMYIESNDSGLSSLVVAIKGDVALKPVNGKLPDVIKRVRYNANDLRHMKSKVVSALAFGDGYQGPTTYVGVSNKAVEVMVAIGAGPEVRKILLAKGIPDDVFEITESDARACAGVGQSSFGTKFVDEDGELIDGVTMAYSRDGAAFVRGKCELLSHGNDRPIPLCRHMPMNQSGKFFVTAAKDGYESEFREFEVERLACGIRAKSLRIKMIRVGKPKI